VILPSTITPCPIHALTRRSSDEADSVAFVRLSSRDRFTVDIQGSFSAMQGIATQGAQAGCHTREGQRNGKPDGLHPI
jgi:hypothetical protein